MGCIGVALCSHFTTCVYRDGFIYGVDGNTGRRCNLVCLRASDGPVAWEKETGFATPRLGAEQLCGVTGPGMPVGVQEQDSRDTGPAGARDRPGGIARARGTDACGDRS